MTKDYPDYYPPFMRDFHDSKDTIKAFYTWLDLMDNKQRMDEGYQLDRPAKCSWVDFNILVVSFIDFMHSLGYTFYKTRGKDKVDADPYQAIRAFKDLDNVLHSLIAPGDILTYQPEYCVEFLDQFGEGWLRLMSTAAIQEYRKLKQEHEAKLSKAEQETA